MRNFAFCCLLTTLIATPICGQEHSHTTAENSSNTRKVETPKVFLDKSPRIVAYQLKRLDNQRLLMVERKRTDEKYIPVYEAILARIGMSPQFRLESINALAELQQSDPVTITIATIGKLDASNRDEKRTAKQLARMLLGMKTEQLKAKATVLREMTQSDNALASAIATAALLISGQSDAELDKLTEDSSGQLAFLEAITMLPEAAQRGVFRSRVVSLLDSSASIDLSNAAIRTLGFIPSQPADSFSRLAPLISNEKLRSATVRTLLTIPMKEREADTSLTATSFLVDLA